MAKGIDKATLLESLEKQRKTAQTKFDKATAAETGAAKKVETATAALTKAQGAKAEAQQTLTSLESQIDWAKSMPEAGSAPDAASADPAFDGGTPEEPAL